MNRFLLIWICAALVVVLARGLAVANLGYDLTVQLQAAQNLADGHGLSIYDLGGENDLAQSEKLVTLTHFPAGYSLFAAALFKLGIGTAGVLKTGGAVATILGWWGWGLLAYFFFKEGLSRSRIWRAFAVVIAIATPLLFTPPWHGTDIFLWAAVPWVVFLVAKGASRPSSPVPWFDLAAGSVCGLCVLIRYASAFLLMYAGCVILYQSRVSWKMLWRRASALAAGAFPFLALQLYINRVIATPHQAPTGIASGHTLSNALKVFWDGFWMLSAANIAVVWWMPRRLLELLTQPGAKLLSQDAYSPWWLAIPLGILVLALPIAAILAARWTDLRDARSAAIALFWAIPLFLWACMLVGTNDPFVGTYRYVADLRYYVPIIPLAVLVAYALAVPTGESETAARRVARWAGLSYVVFYSLLVIAGVARLVIPLDLGAASRSKLMGTSELYHWPSAGISYQLSAARQYAFDLLEAHPDAIVVTDHPQWFYAEPKVDRSRIHRFGDIQSHYVSGPAHIIVIAGDICGGAVEDLCWMTADGKMRRAAELSHVQNLRLVTRFPAEHMKILEADVPASIRVAVEQSPSPAIGKPN